MQVSGAWGSAGYLLWRRSTLWDSFLQIEKAARVLSLQRPSNAERSKTYLLRILVSSRIVSYVAQTNSVSDEEWAAHSKKHNHNEIASEFWLKKVRTRLRERSLKNTASSPLVAPLNCAHRIHWFCSPAVQVISLIYSFALNKIQLIRTRKVSAHIIHAAMTPSLADDRCSGNFNCFAPKHSISQDSPTLCGAPASVIFSIENLNLRCLSIQISATYSANLRDAFQKFKTGQRSSSFAL